MTNLYEHCKYFMKLDFEENQYSAFLIYIVIISMDQLNLLIINNYIYNKYIYFQLGNFKSIL